MSFKLELGADEFKEQFESNKELYISLGVLLGAALLFIMSILPNILDFPRKLSERNVEVEKLNKIKEAQKIIDATDVNLIDEEVEVVTKALPSDRNFELILGAISEAAARSGARVVSYEYNDRSRPGRRTAQDNTELVFDIGILGDVNDSSKFSNELLKTYPVSDIREISYSENLSKVSVAFYYKPFTKVQSQEVALARNKTAKEREALEEIETWNSYSFEQIFIDQIATVAAELIDQ